MRKKGKYQAPKRRLSKSTSAEGIYKRNSLKCKGFFLVSLTFILASFYLSTLAVLEKTHIERNVLLDEIELLETENDRLRLEIGYLDVLEKIEEEAVEKLGMQAGGPEQKLTVENFSAAARSDDAAGAGAKASSYIPSPPAFSAGQKQGQARNSQSEEATLFASAQESITNLLSRWAF